MRMMFFRGFINLLICPKVANFFRAFVESAISGRGHNYTQIIADFPLVTQPEITSF